MINSIEGLGNKIEDILNIEQKIEEMENKREKKITLECHCSRSNS